MMKDLYDPSLVNIDKKSYKNIGCITNIEYITKKY